MSWLSDVTGVNWDVAKPILDATNPVNLFPEDSSIRNFVRTTQTVGQAGLDFIWKPVEAGWNVGRGDYNGAADSGKKWLGSVGIGYSVATPGGAALYAGAQTPEGQAALKDPAVARATLGLSDDYAGMTRGFTTLSRDAQLSDGDRDSLLRYLSKAVAIYGLTAVSSTAASAGKDGGVAATGPGKSTISSWYTGGQAAARGDYLGAIGAIAPTVPGVSDIIPKRPDWLPSIDLTPGTPNPVGAPGSRPAVPVSEASPWEWGGPADSGISASKIPGGVAMPLAVAGAAILAVYVLRKRGII